jgi:glycosyltransferase involved in cell wall biosynthesis
MRKFAIGDNPTMKLAIDLVAPALPPQLDGIGDYCSYLSGSLSGRARLGILTVEGHEHTSIPDIDIKGVFTPGRRKSVDRIAEVVLADRPDWLILQFNQFSYGRWGLNPFLPGVLRSIQKGSRVRIAVMFHEDFVPQTTWKFRIMRIWQKWQFKQLGSIADVVFFSIDPWVKKYSGWFPGKPVVHLPVGANLPRTAMSRAEARERLGISDQTLVIGLFGSSGGSRMLDRVKVAVETAKENDRDVMLLYMGANGAVIRQLVSGIRVVAEGPLLADEVSRRLHAVDIYLAPFADGVSTRRGSMMAGLQHGLATVGTLGELTDDMLRKEHGRSILLADVSSVEEFAAQVRRLAGDAALRDQLGRAAQELYDRCFDWEPIATKMLSTLEAYDRDRSEPAAEVLAGSAN